MNTLLSFRQASHGVTRFFFCRNDDAYYYKKAIRVILPSPRRKIFIKINVYINMTLDSGRNNYCFLTLLYHCIPLPHVEVQTRSVELGIYFSCTCIKYVQVTTES